MPIQQELRSHLEMAEADAELRGLARADAARAARINAGGTAQAMEALRHQRGLPWLEDAVRDVGYALRMLRRTPSFTIVAVATLALGIGSATAIFSLLHNILVEPFPYTAPPRMVDVVIRNASDGVFRGPFPPDEFLAYQQQSDVFESVAGTITESVHYVGPSGAERMSLGWGTPDMFTFLGVEPLHGRSFGPADVAPGAPEVVVLNHRTWTTAFGADLGIIGRTVRLNNRPWTVIGIMPPRFEWHVADFWAPAVINESVPSTEPRYARWFQARLKRGVSVEAAEAQLSVIAQRRAAQFPNDYPAGTRLDVITIIDWVAGQFRVVLYTLFGAVGLLLLIACCNVANMLLARATAREQEILIRAALGASRTRILRQLLVESLMLAAGGLIVGSLVVYGGIAIMAGLLPRQGVAWEVALELDRPVLAFALVAAALATIVFGLVPAWQTARRDLVAGATAGGRSGTASRRQHRLRGALVVAEVALSLVLLLGAGLLARSFVHLASAETGLGTDPTRLFATGIAFQPGTPVHEQDTFRRNLLPRLRAIPGVQSVAVSSAFLGGMSGPLNVPGLPEPLEPRRVLVQFVDETLLDTFGLPVTRGHGLSASDVEAARKVVVVNDTMVRDVFGGANPVGRIVRLDRLSAPPFTMTDTAFEIVGVVADVKNTGLRTPTMPHAYVPSSLRGPIGLQVFARSTGDAALLTTPVRNEMQRLDPRVAMINPRSIASQLDQGTYAQPRFSLSVLLLFAATGLALVALGVYGVISYTVAQQSREFAIRMALGGERRHVLRQVLLMTLKLLGVGTVVGVAAGVGVARLLTTQLVSIAPHDPATFAASIAVIALIGVIACAVPARRATRVEPSVALRHE